MEEATVGDTNGSDPDSEYLTAFSSTQVQKPTRYDKVHDYDINKSQTTSTTEANLIKLVDMKTRNENLKDYKFNTEKVTVRRHETIKQAEGVSGAEINFKKAQTTNKMIRYTTIPTNKTSDHLKGQQAAGASVTDNFSSASGITSYYTAFTKFSKGIKRGTKIHVVNKAPDIAPTSPKEEKSYLPSCIPVRTILKVPKFKCIQRNLPNPIGTLTHTDHGEQIPETLQTVIQPQIEHADMPGCSYKTYEVQPPEKEDVIKINPTAKHFPSTDESEANLDERVQEMFIDPNKKFIALQELKIPLDCVLEARNVSTDGHDLSNKRRRVLDYLHKMSLEKHVEVPEMGERVYFVACNQKMIRIATNQEPVLSISKLAEYSPPEISEKRKKVVSSPSSTLQLKTDNSSDAHTGQVVSSLAMAINTATKMRSSRIAEAISVIENITPTCMIEGLLFAFSSTFKTALRDDATTYQKFIREDMKQRVIFFFEVLESSHKVISEFCWLIPGIRDLGIDFSNLIEKNKLELFVLEIVLRDYPDSCKNKQIILPDGTLVNLKDLMAPFPQFSSLVTYLITSYQEKHVDFITALLLKTALLFDHPGEEQQVTILGMKVVESLDFHVGLQHHGNKKNDHVIELLDKSECLKALRGNLVKEIMDVAKQFKISPKRICKFTTNLI